MKISGTLNGFTLVELVITIAIAAIIACMAAPSFLSFSRNSNLKTANTALYNVLAQARNEAITQGQAVGVCPSANGETCLPSNTDWPKGWISWRDTNQNQSPDTSESIITVARGVNSPVTLTPTASIGAVLEFNPQGVISSAGSFTFCDDRGAAFASAVVFYVYGGVQITNKKHDGGSLSCI